MAKDNSQEQAARLIKELNFMGSRNKTPIYIGVDPGSTGAIAFLWGNEYAVVDIPTTKKKVGKKNRTEFDHHVICDLFAEFVNHADKVTVLVEEPPPGFGQASSRFSQFLLGQAFAMWPLYFKSLGFTVERVSPTSWKARLQLSTDKEKSRRLAIRLFPDAPLGRKKDHNRAEALLLAHYLKRSKTNALPSVPSRTRRLPRKRALVPLKSRR